MERIVLDTNVLVDGAKDDLSASWRIVEDVLDGRLVAAVSRPLLDEYRLILHRTVLDEKYHERISKFLSAAETVRPTRVASGVIEDPEDVKVLATALGARADAVISSDHHLLDLDPYDGMRVLTPQAFLNRRTEERGGGWEDFARSLGIGG